jgi:hypothetical protein
LNWNWSLAMPRDAVEERRRLSAALVQMVEALGILDRLGPQGEIGANLDLAIARLERELGRDNSAPTFEIASSLLAKDTYGGDPYHLHSSLLFGRPPFGAGSPVASVPRPV